MQWAACLGVGFSPCGEFCRKTSVSSFRKSVYARTPLSRQFGVLNSSPDFLGLSPNTIKAYRDVFTLLLRFCRDVQGIVPERLCLEQIDVTRVETLLDYLERERKILSSYTKSSARCLACFLHVHSGRRTGPCSAHRKIYVESTDAHALRMSRLSRWEVRKRRNW